MSHKDKTQVEQELAKKETVVTFDSGVEIPWSKETIVFVNDIKHFNELVKKSIRDKVPTAPVFLGTENKREFLDKVETYQHAFKTLNQTSYNALIKLHKHVTGLRGMDWEKFKELLWQKINNSNN